MAVDEILTNSGTSLPVTTVTVSILTACLIFYWVFTKKVKNLPPGPREWGSTWQILKATMNESLHELATDWATKYGQITYVNFLGRPIAFLNNPDITRRIFASESLKYAVANRVLVIASKLGMYNGKDLFFTPYDALMRKKRRIFHSVMALYGDGAERFEKIVLGEMERLFSELEQHENEDIELWKHLSRSLKHIFFILVTGQRPNNDKLCEILEEYDTATNKLWVPDIDFVLTNFPVLAIFPGRFKKAVDRLMASKGAAEDLMYFQPKKSWIPGKPRGIADHLFDLYNKPGYEWIQEDPEHAIAFLNSIYLAGHLTSRATLLGAFLCLINHPRVAQKIQEEIDTVLGDRLPKLEDKMSLPYTEASILETLRLISQVPFGGVRDATADIHIDGMTIPKGTLVFFNAWYFHHDERLWEHPWTFKPERFLDSEGQLLPANHPVRKNLLAFGIGVRACPGEVFAKSRAFMFITRILQKYDLLPPDNEDLVPADFRTNHDAVKGFVRQVRPYACRLRRREKVAT